MADATPAATSLSSVKVAARILREFGRHSTQLGVSQLARRVGVGKSTAHRVIWTLVAEGLLEKVEETGLFRLTAAMSALGASAETSQRLHDAATGAFDALRTVTDGTLHVAILDGAEVLYVVRRQGAGALDAFRAVGTRIGAYCTASGKVLLAFLPDDEREQLLDRMRLTPRTPRTITSRDALVRELDRVRSQGFAVNQGESALDLCSIAAPIRDRHGRVIASVSIVKRLDDTPEGMESLRHPALATAARISSELARGD